MSYFLNIETATTVCSVSVFKNEELLFLKELDNGFTHAENLHLFIESGLKETGLSPSELDAIAVSKGPGSYTGLRIGVSTAKGLAYALSVPLISVDTLQIMTAAAAAQLKEEAIYCPMIDARRMEVYTALYDRQLQQQAPVNALIVDETSIESFRAYPNVCYFGDGMPKCRALLQSMSNAVFLDAIVPSAAHMIRPVLSKFNRKEFEDVAYFEPFYLKDFLILKKKG